MTTRMDPVEAARIFVDCHFPEAAAAFVGGSVIQGEATSTSDLDIVVVTDRPEAPYRESFRALGWPIETFVHTPASMWHYVEQDARNLRPCLLRATCGVIGLFDILENESIFPRLAVQDRDRG